MFFLNEEIVNGASISNKIVKRLERQPNRIRYNLWREIKYTETNEEILDKCHLLILKSKGSFSRS